MNTRKIRFTAYFIIICMMLPSIVRAEVNNEAIYSIETNETAGWPQGPDVNSETAVLMEADTGIVLYDKGMNEKRYPASITKIMTALLALENCSLDEQVTFTESGLAHIAEGTNIGMQPGEVMTMEQCLYVLLIKSANEVADQVAEYVGGTRENFIEMMNTKAVELQCTNTHFNNPSGLPDENHWSTAYDMALIFQEAQKNEDFCKIIQTLQYTIEPTNMNAEAREITSHHALLVPSAPEYYEGCLGGKTGVTVAAKNTLVTGVQRGDTRLIAVVMRADAGQVCADTQSLFDYGYDNFEKLEVAGGMLVVPKGTLEADLETVDTQTDTDVLYSYYYNEYPVGTATMSIEELNALQEEEAAATEEDSLDQQQTDEELQPQESAGQDDMVMKYRIAIVILIAMIFIILLLIIIKIVSRSGKQKSPKRKKGKRKKK